MLRRIAPVNDLKKAKSSSNPENWNDTDFINTPLSVLSKTLSESLTNKRTLAVYFRWIEVHRRQITGFTEDWGDTLIQWALALRSRGFDKEGLISAVREYKDAKVIHDSEIRASPGKIRCLPMAYDVGKAWAGAYPGAPKQDYYWGGSNRYMKHQMKADDFAGTPSGDYVCNRCHTAGHYLEACPTNLDPSYDKPPNMRYKCPICFEHGVHYKSLCPQNKDPFSIIQKRRNLGIVTTGDKSTSQLLRSWQSIDDGNENNGVLRGPPVDQSWARGAVETTYRTVPGFTPGNDLMSFSPNSNQSDRKSKEVKQKLKEIDEMKAQIEQSDSVQTSDVLMIRNRVNGQRTAEKRTRTISPDPSIIRERRVTKNQSPSPSKYDTLRKKMFLIEQYEFQASQGEQLNPGSQALIEKKAVYKARLEKLEKDQDMIGPEYSVDIERDDSPGLPYRNAPALKRVKLDSYHGTPPDSAYGMNNVMGMGMKIDSDGGNTSKIITHTDFMKKLIDRYPDMTKVINPVRRVQTAASMWDDEDDRKLKMLALADAAKSSQEVRPLQASHPPYKRQESQAKVDADMYDQWFGEGHDNFQTLDRLDRSFERTKENVKAASGWS